MVLHGKLPLLASTTWCRIASMSAEVVLRCALPLVCCCLAPGYLAQRVLCGSDSAGQPIRWWEAALGATLGSVLWTSAYSMVLLQLGAFSLWALLIGNAVVSLGLLSFLVGRGRLRRQGIAPLTAVDAGIVAALILVTGVYPQPHEFLLGGADAGVYVSLGEHIAETGGWQRRDEVIAELPEAVREAVLREQPDWALTRYVHLPGFYVTDPKAGEITPQFYPLHPLWMAIYNAAGGLRLSLYATPVWGVLGVAAVAATACAVFGERTGLLSLALVACTATQIWFSRYQTAEPLTQFLIFGGIWSLAMYLRRGMVWHALLAGAALGQATLARIDVYFLVAIPLFLGVWRVASDRLRCRDAAFVLPMVFHVAQSLLFGWTRSRPYFLSIYGRYLDELQRLSLVAALSILAIALLLIFLAAGLLRGVRRSEASRSRADRVWDVGMRGIAMLVVALALFAYFIRPVLVEDGTWNYWYGGYTVPAVEQFNLVRLGWYLTPLGLMLAVGGAAVVLWRRVTPDRAVLMGVGLFFSVLFVANSHNNPHHIYVMRRYVPVVIPFLTIMMAATLDALGTVRWLPRWSVAALAVAQLVWLIAAAWLPLTHIEYAGLLETIDDWAMTLGDPAVILFNDDLPVSAGAQLGTPLHYIYGHTVLDLQEDRVDPAVLASQVSIWLSEGRRVVLAEGSSAVSGLTEPLVTEVLPRFHATYGVLEVSYEHKPREVWAVTMDVDFYEVSGVR